MRTGIILCLAALANLAGATEFTFVPIPGDNNIQTALINTFPTGTFTANNTLATPFSISSAPGKCGPSGTAPCNIYGFTASGQSITLNVSVASPTDVYTLINALSPPPGAQLGTIKFVGSAGASLTFPLIAGENIRDYYHGAWANTLNNGIAGVEAINAFSCVDPANCLGSGATGNVQTGNHGAYVVDEQDFSLGTTFAGQTLTQIVLSDTATGGGTPILLGVTVGAAGDARPAVSSGGVVSASAFGGFASIAPGSWIEIYGANLAVDTRVWGGSDFTGVNAPTSLDGTFVSIGGESAFVDYISSGQVNAQVPSSVAAGSQQLIVTTGAGSSVAYPVTVKATEPGLLAPSSFKIAGTQYVAALFPDGATYVLPEGAISGVASRPAKPGDTIVLYGVGFGPVTPNIPAGQVVEEANMLASKFSISIGGVEATVNYFGLAPSFVGLYQFNVVVPDAASGAAPVAFTLGASGGSQTLYLSVDN